jgi:glycerol-3-phosphate cytidylyltransferase-like family protein
VLTDEAIASYKSAPVMTHPQRVEVMSALRQVSRVVVQDTLDYEKNLRKLEPD